MKNFPSGVLPPLLVFGISTLLGFLLYFENDRARAISAPNYTRSGQTVSGQTIVPDKSGIADAQTRVQELRNQLARAQLLSNPDPEALRQLRLAELEHQRQEWERNLQSVLADSYQGVMAEFSDQTVEIHNDYLFDNLALEPLQRSMLLAALTATEREKRRLYEDLRLGRLTQADYHAALADIRADDATWKEALSETQFLRYQELHDARIRQGHLATAVGRAMNSTGPMSEHGRELLIAAYAGLLEKNTGIDSSTSNPAQVYEAMLSDYADMVDWLAPQLSGYDHVAMETFLGYRGLELQERFLEQLHMPSPAVMP